MGNVTKKDGFDQMKNIFRQIKSAPMNNRRRSKRSVEVNDAHISVSRVGQTDDHIVRISDYSNDGEYMDKSFVTKRKPSIKVRW